MKALSLRQPWAYLVARGHKDIENRTWSTAYRGPLLIHASQRADTQAVAYFAQAYRENGYAWPPWSLRTGGIVGIVTVTDCVTESESDWFDGPIGWVLQDAHRLPFIPLSGKLKLFDVPDDLVADILMRRSLGHLLP